MLPLTGNSILDFDRVEKIATSVLGVMGTDTMFHVASGLPLTLSRMPKLTARQAKLEATAANSRRHLESQ